MSRKATCRWIWRRRAARFATAALLVLAWLLGSAAQAQQMQALARLDGAESAVTDAEAGARLVLVLSQPVPWKVSALADPPRLVLDFAEVVWSSADLGALDRSEMVSGARAGLLRPGWSRLVLDLAEPMLPASAQMRVDEVRGTARIEVDLRPATAEEIAAAAAHQPPGELALPAGAQRGEARPRQRGDRPLVVAIDPGHGGIDPGAERMGHLEKDIVLQFARELAAALERTGRYKPVLTRTDDSFVSLPDRISIARAAKADVFISLHADALKEGDARGTTVYTLSEQASDTMAEELARSHDRGDLLAGVDLSQQDDAIAAVLMDMARIETDARSNHLAERLVDGIAKAVGHSRARPHLSAGFTVLKAPDIPSVLIEIGFISNRRDLQNMLTPRWREQVVSGIVAALDRWMLEDAAQARALER